MLLFCSSGRLSRKADSIQSCWLAVLGALLLGPFLIPSPQSTQQADMFTVEPALPPRRFEDDEDFEEELVEAGEGGPAPPSFLWRRSLRTSLEKAGEA